MLLIWVAVGAAALVGVNIVLLIHTHRRHRAAEEELLSDELTGVGNRRRLDRDLAMNRVKADTPVAVIKVDVDHFQQINERHGSPIGDEVLRQLADVLRREVRSGDVVYRCEDAEFCVLLAKTTSGEAGLVAERIRFAVAELAVASDDGVTVSIGVALGRAQHVTETMHRADDALAKSKDDGCDRVTLAAQPLLGPLAVSHHID